MSVQQRPHGLPRCLHAFACAMLLISPFAANAQEQLTSQWEMATTRVSLDRSSPRQSIRMVINQSREITADQNFKTVTIQNPSILSALPVEGNRLQVSALATGITTLDLEDANGEMHSIEVMVLGDVRELEAAIRTVFPDCNISVMPVQTSCVVSGYVTDDEHVEKIIRIAEQFFPTVINNIVVTGVHTIQLEVQIMEVSRTKLRELGIDWAISSGGTTVAQAVGGLLDPDTLAGTGSNNFNISIIDGSDTYFAALQALRQNNLVKVLATPTLTAIDGRPASFNAGGEIPIVVPAGLGQVAIQFREFGTRLDYVAKVKGNGKIWLEVRPYVSEIDPTRSVTLDGINVPGLRSRFLETGVELSAGQTLALGGLLQVRTEAINSGIPVLADMPYVGTFFRSTAEEKNEVELLITVTPNFAGPMEPHEVPLVAPGTQTQSPTDKDLYLRGYIETPLTGDANCATPGYGNMMTSPVVPVSAPSAAPMGPVGGYGIPMSTQPSAPTPNPAAMSVGPNAPKLAQPTGFAIPSKEGAPVIR